MWRFELEMPGGDDVLATASMRRFDAEAARAEAARVKEAAHVEAFWGVECWSLEMTDSPCTLVI